MLQQILMHTPAYVWAILAFLVYRGVAASKDRVVSYRSVFIIPGVMLVLGLNSVANGFGLGTPAGLAWLTAAVAGAALAWTWTGSHGTDAVDHAAGTVTQRGSWTPLALMMAVFCCKYVVGAALAVQPGLSGDLRFAVPACFAFGLFNGIFLGRLLRTAAGWQATRPAAPSAA